MTLQEDGTTTAQENFWICKICESQATTSGSPAPASKRCDTKKNGAYNNVAHIKLKHSTNWVDFAIEEHKMIISGKKPNDLQYWEDL